MNLSHGQDKFCIVYLDNEPVHGTENPVEDIREKIRNQLNYYFSEKNILHDKYLRSKMDSEDYVSISVIAGFNMLRLLTDDIALITDVFKGSFYIHQSRRNENNRKFVSLFLVV